MKKEEDNTSAEILNIVNNLLSDGNTHTAKEMKALCVNEGINFTENRYALNNTLQKLKKQGIIENTEEKGTYRLSVKGANKSNSSIVSKNSIKIDLDWNNFFVLKPTSSKYNEMKVTVNEKGEIRLNSALQKELQASNIQLILSNDYKILYLKPSDENAHKFTKAGICKNKNIVKHIQKLKLNYPVTYRIQWDEKVKMWKGTLDIQTE